MTSAPSSTISATVPVLPGLVPRLHAANLLRMLARVGALVALSLQVEQAMETASPHRRAELARWWLDAAIRS